MRFLGRARATVSILATSSGDAGLCSENVENGAAEHSSNCSGRSGQRHPPHRMRQMSPWSSTHGSRTRMHGSRRTTLHRASAAIGVLGGHASTPVPVGTLGRITLKVRRKHQTSSHSSILRQSWKRSSRRVLGSARQVPSHWPMQGQAMALSRELGGLGGCGEEETCRLHTCRCTRQQIE